MLKRYFAAGGVLLFASITPAHACFTMERTVRLTEAQVNQLVRQSFERLPELFEGEVITDGSGRALMVSRVFKGTLRPGMLLREDPSIFIEDTCRVRPTRVGDRGILMVGFGPKGPTYVDSFVSEETVAALRRIGAIPS